MDVQAAFVVIDVSTNSTAGMPIFDPGSVIQQVTPAIVGGLISGLVVFILIMGAGWVFKAVAVANDDIEARGQGYDNTDQYLGDKSKWGTGRF